jgi:hypothetical protein
VTGQIEKDFNSGESRFQGSETHFPVESGTPYVSSELRAGKILIDSVNSRRRLPFSGVTTCCSSCGNRFLGSWDGHPQPPSGDEARWADAYLARFHERHCDLWRNHASRSSPTYQQSLRVIAGIAIRALPALDEHFLAWAGTRLKRAQSVGVVNHWANEFGRDIAPVEPAVTDEPVESSVDRSYGAYCERCALSGETPISFDAWIDSPPPITPKCG